MKKVLYFPILLLLMAIVNIDPAKASHCVGGDLTYTYQGPNTYLLTLRFYRDCFGIAPQTSYDLCYQSASCGLSGTVTVNPIPGTGQPIPPSPCLPPVVTTCQGGSAYGVEEWIYQGTVTLPDTCSDWIFSFWTTARNAQITNLVTPANWGFYLSTRLDNSNYPINSSPFFLNIPVTQFCVNNQFYYNQQASDPDGDSLVYSLVAAEDATGGCPQTPNNLAYMPTFSATNPITTSTGVNIDPNTGLISFIPTVQEVDVICVKVDEYRNGVKIGSVKRDIQMNVTASCLPNTPTFDSTIFNGQNFILNANCADTTIFLPLQIPIQCGSVVSTDVRLTDPNGLPNPVLSAIPYNCQNGMTDTVLITVLFPFTAGTTYLFTKIGNDGNTFLSECGTQMAEFDSIAIVVLDTGIYIPPIQDVSCFFTQLTVTFSEEFSCNTIAADASDFHFVDAVGTNFPIISVTNNCNPGVQYDFTNQLTFTFSSGVLGTGPYYLIAQSGSDLNTIANKCGTFFDVGDTLAIFNVTNNIIVNLGPDLILCASDPMPVLDAGNPGVTFTWYFNGVQLSDTTQTIIGDSTGMYTVVCYYSGTCQGSDTVNVLINPAPTPNVGVDIAICEGDTPPTFNVTGVTGPATYQWYFNGFPLAGDTLATLIPDTSLGSGNYSVIVNTGGSCNGTDDLNFTINPAATVNAGPNQTICADTTATMAAIFGGGASSGTWSTSGTGIFSSNNTNAVYTPSAADITAGTVTLTYTTDDPPGPCNAATSSMVLTILAAPSIAITGNQVACLTDTIFATSGFSTYQWYVDGVLSGTTGSSLIITNADGLPHTYSVTVSNGTCSNSAQYTVTVYPSAPTPTVSNASYCSGTSVPSLDAGVSGSGVTYQWYDNSGNVITGATNQQYTPGSAGTYSVTVSIGGGLCTSSASATITQVNTPQPTLSPVTTCAGDNNPVVLDAGNGPFTYQWYGNTGNAIPGATNSTYNVPQPFVTSNYSVTVTNTQNGISCSGSASMTFTVNPPVTVSIGNDQTICEGGVASFTATAPTAVSYLWSDNSTSQTLQTSAAGTYTVTATDGNNCKGTGTVNLFVNAAPALSISASDTITNSQIKVCEVNPFPLLTASATNAISYVWTFTNINGTVNNNYSTASSVQVSNEGYGTYEVEVTDINGCTSRTSVDVVPDPCALIIPNVITPNGDGDNEVFYIENIGTHHGNNLKIFNRWGNEVFETNEYQNNWNGEDFPGGTYYYILSTAEQKYSGTITLIREEKK